MTTKPEALRLAVASGAMADEGQMIHLLSWVEIRNLLRADATELRRQHAEIERLQAERDALLSALKGLLTRDYRNTCQHDETHRGGAIWTICNSCGAKWADDEGGKPEWVEPPEWEAARAAISTATGAAA